MRDVLKEVSLRPLEKNTAAKVSTRMLNEDWNTGAKSISSLEDRLALGYSFCETDPT